MKSMTKAELAKAAGVSSRTFSRWLIRHREELALLGVSPHAHLIPPIGVKYILETFCIDIRDNER